MPRPTNQLKILHAISGESEPRSSKYLAEKTGLQVNEVARHLRVLKSMGLVRSHAGQKTVNKPMTWFIVFLPSVAGNTNGHL
jgi:predicted transcriptional regulator